MYRHSHALLQLLSIGALTVAGRPVLACLYFVHFFVLAAFQVSLMRAEQGVERPHVSAYDWAAYQAFPLLGRTIKWVLWVPFIFVIGAFLSHAEVRMTRGRRQALGLPRPLAGLLFAAPYRRLWQTALPFAFWLVSSFFALGLAFGVLPAAAARHGVTILCATAITCSTLIFLALVFAHLGERGLPSRRQMADWPRMLAPYLRVLVQLVFSVALCIAEQWIVAGLFLAAICLSYSVAWRGSTDVADDWRHCNNPFPALAVLCGMALAIGPFVALASPILLPSLVWDLWSDIRTARRLRQLFKKPKGLIYFLYGEPHHYEHFLGEGGVLASFREQVVARDWRAEVRPARDGEDGQAFHGSPEGRLLERWKISRRREHLPFIAVVGPRPWPMAFHLSETYRARRRDGGKSLDQLEARLRKVLTAAFAARA